MLKPNEPLPRWSMLQWRLYFAKEEAWKEYRQRGYCSYVEGLFYRVHQLEEEVQSELGEDA